jgi:transcriptional regulator GlxA family with amidase domain
MGTPPEPNGPGNLFRVTLLAYPLVDELDLFGAYSVLGKAASVDPRLEVRIAARESSITGSGGVTFAVTEGIDAVGRADAVVVPGGRGAQQAAEDPELRRVLLAAAERGARFYAVCTGTFLIAAAGLARNSELAVHHAKRDLLSAYPVGAVAEGLVLDGRIRSVGGVRRSSVKSVDLAFQLLNDFAPDTVAPVSARMEVAAS